MRKLNFRFAYPEAILTACNRYWSASNEQVTVIESMDED